MSIVLKIHERVKRASSVESSSAFSNRFSAREIGISVTRKSRENSLPQLGIVDATRRDATVRCGVVRDDILGSHELSLAVIKAYRWSPIKRINPVKVFFAVKFDNPYNRGTPVLLLLPLSPLAPMYDYIYHSIHINNFFYANDVYVSQ